MEKYRTQVCLLLLSVCFAASAGERERQQGTEMSLEELFRVADANSKSQRIHAFKEEEAHKGLSAARRERLPNIDAAVSFSYLGDGRVWDRDFSDGMKADIPHYGNNFVLSASQVIYSGGAVSGGIAMADLAEKAAAQEKLQDRGNLRFLLAGYYLELYKLDNQMRVYDRNIALTEDLVALAKAQYGQGTALQNDVTRYELQLENYRLARTRIGNSRHILNYRLNKLAGLDEGTIVVPDTTLLSALPAVEAVGEWQQTAGASAPSVALSSLGIRQSRQHERIVRSASLPHVALVAEEHLDGPVTIEIPALDKNFNYWFVGVGISFNLSSLYRNKSRISQARIETRRHEEEHALLLDELACTVEDDHTRYREALHETGTLQTNVRLARENYATLHTRYRNGLALATDMLEVANTLLDAELQLANAHANVHYAYYKLKHTSGTL